MLMAFKEIDPKTIDFSNAPLFRKIEPLHKDNIEIAEEDQEVITYFEDEHEETRNTVYKGDYIITGLAGERYALRPDKFTQKYEQDPQNPDLYQSKNTGRAVLVTEAVSFKAPWGEKQMMQPGSSIMMSGPDDIFGIHEDALALGYGRADEDGNVFVSLKEPLEAQRVAAAASAAKHLADIDARKSFALSQVYETKPPEKEL